MNSNIDVVKTGEKIETLIRSAGYTVKDIQGYLGLNCPQSIYRWFKGQILPSVTHLYALSRLLNVHMEELVVMQNVYDERITVRAKETIRRVMAYHTLFMTERG